MQSPGLHPNSSCYLGSRDGQAGHLESQKRCCLQWLHPKLSYKLERLIPGGLHFFTSEKIVTILNEETTFGSLKLSVHTRVPRLGGIPEDSCPRRHQFSPPSLTSPSSAPALCWRCAECQTYRQQTDGVFVMLHLLQMDCGSKVSWFYIILSWRVCEECI